MTLWLLESCPPRIGSEPEAIPTQRCKRRSTNQPVYYEERTGQTCETVNNIELFHPDFAEWSSIQQAQVIENAVPDGLLHVFDDAAETLSKLLLAPFGIS